MNLILNILWLIVGGLGLAIAWFLGGIILCITIIGIPFGRQCFKYAKLMLSPFGKKVETNFKAHPIVNILWLIFFGITLAISYIIIGLAICVTIVGIPFGIQCFKFSKLALIPFGAEIVKK